MLNIYLGCPPVERTGMCFNKAGRHAERIFLEDVLQNEMLLISQLRTLHLLTAGQALATVNPNLYILPYLLAGSSQTVITLFINYSPCADCARRLYNLAVHNPNFRIIIHFIKLYKCTGIFSKDKGQNMEGLRKLRTCANVDLDVITHQEYSNMFGPYVDMNTKQELERIVNGPDLVSLAKQLAAMSLSK